VEAANEAKRKRDSAELAFAEKGESLWATFLQELRELSEEYNGRAEPDRQVTISAPEPNVFALGNHGNHQRPVRRKVPQSRAGRRDRSNRGRSGRNDRLTRLPSEMAARCWISRSEQSRGSTTNRSEPP
jgi:hypothetical protein